MTTPIVDKRIVCSAPGKVLVTGGYLVLDKKYDGIVFTIDSRFYTTIEGTLKVNQSTQQPNSVSTDTLSSSFDSLEYLTDINVISPQFHSSQNYHIYHNKSNENKLYQFIPFGNTTTTEYRENKYVENTIIYTLITLCTYNNQTIESFNKLLSKYQIISITIVGDNGFYSQIPQLVKRNLSISFESLKSLPKFLPVTGSLQELQKTGLGSSAALVSSLTASLLSFFDAIDLESTNNEKLLKDKTLLHNLAQVSHCIAQGKIGSGFDISSAVFGSQVYRRFSPELINDILKLYDSKLYPNSVELLKCILGEWDNKHLDMGLPRGLHLLLADVSVGSNTPVMVKKILEWRKNDSTNADRIWNQLDIENTNVKHYFIKLNQLYSENNGQYDTVLNQFGETCQNKWESLIIESQSNSFIGYIGKTLISIRNSFLNIRSLMREMGSLADVPLEPIEQSELADSTMSIKGCIASGVPGAGGFDALFAIVISNQDEIKNSWMSWKKCQVLPLVLNENSTGVSIDMSHETPKL